jgi:hypothetical protein
MELNKNCILTIGWNKRRGRAIQAGGTDKVENWYL